MITPPKPSVMPRSDESRPAMERKRPMFGVRMVRGEVEYDIPGYQLSWVTDYEDGRLSYALECGYNFVLKDEVGLKNTESNVSSTDDTANRVSQYAGIGVRGTPLNRYLMKVPVEIYEEVQALVAAQTDAAENDIYSGSQTPVEGKYVSPRLGTKISSKIV